MNGDVKEITMKEFLAEYRSGTMTEERVKQILSVLYERGWEDRNALQVKANKINRKTRKFETDEFKDVLNDVCADISEQTGERIDNIKNYIIEITSSKVVSYLNDNNIKITDKDLNKLFAVSIVDLKNTICRRINKIDETVEKRIEAKEFEAKQNTLFND